MIRVNVSATKTVRLAAHKIIDNSRVDLSLSAFLCVV